MKAKTLAQLDKELWRWFSLYIRLRDADESGTVQCATCGKLLYYKQADAGHFISRRHRAVKYSEANVYPQCKTCNRFEGGHWLEMEAHVRELYGEPMVLELKHRAKMVTKLDRTWLMMRIDEYKRKAKALQEQKG